MLENYGIRVQKSFFQCEMEKKRMYQLRDDLLSIIETEEDSLFFYPLCEECSRKAETIGSGIILRISPFEIL